MVSYSSLLHDSCFPDHSCQQRTPRIDIFSSVCLTGATILDLPGQFSLDYGSDSVFECSFWALVDGKYSCEWHNCSSPGRVTSQSSAECAVPDLSRLPVSLRDTVLRVTAHHYHQSSNNPGSSHCYSHGLHNPQFWLTQDFIEVETDCGGSNGKTAVPSLTVSQINLHAQKKHNLKSSEQQCHVREKTRP